MITDLEEWGTTNGYSIVWQEQEGRIVALLENPFNTQIIVGDEFSVNERYTYAQTVEAIWEFIVWTMDGCQGEPKGWIRHQPSNRRRIAGDPATETIRP